MNIEEYRDYCLAKKGVTESTPFGPSALVFKVMEKVFTIGDLELFASFNVKCDPELAVQLREEFEGVIPGFHMNKKHWNTILMDESVPDKKAKEWIDHSYDLVVQSLTKKDQLELSVLD
jgi:predicted DNA-binding protein (MmcQ/YjbR family)